MRGLGGTVTRWGLALGVVALVASGCAYIREVSNPSGDATFGAFGLPSASTDGRYVAYAIDRDQAAPGTPFGVYLLDAASGTTELVSVASDATPANDMSTDPVVSGDGRYVAFSSDADNLVPDDTNGVSDVFVRDRVARTTTRVSVSTAGVEADDSSFSPSISRDGRYVEFESDSDLLVASDDNFSPDVFVRDRQAGTTVLASTGSLGQTENGAWSGVISGDGRFVAFVTDTGLNSGDDNWDDDVYLKQLGQSTIRISRPRVTNPEGGGGFSPAVSYDGSWVAFASGSADLDTITDTNGAVDVFVRSTATSTTTRVSVAPGGGLLAGSSSQPAISDDGNRVAFTSTGNASGSDTNGTVSDVFVRDRAKQTTVLGSTMLLLDQLSVPSTDPEISGDGRYVFWRSAGAFSGNDLNGVADVYMRAVDVPKFSTMTPSTIARGTTVTISITGNTFLPGARVVMPQDVSVLSTTVNSETSITATIQVLPSAPAGIHSVYVQNLGTGPGPDAGGVGRCTDCLTIT